MEQATSSKHGGEPNPLESAGLCLLSLDGGGVRGLSTLYILKSIMDRLNRDRITANLPRVKPCEIFDLIGGTSTGGLIAIMLGRLEMDVDQCILVYSSLAEAVFGQKKSRLPFNIRGNVKAQFDSRKLEKAIRKTIRDSGRSETELLNDGTGRRCRTFVCTVDHNTKAIVRLRSYILPDGSDIPATIYQAALATSAATTFFEPVSIGNRTFADGGLGANNPVDQVEGEAANIWCSESGDLKPLVKCFLSVGTGNPGIEAFKENIFKFLGQTVVNIATETEETERNFIARWRKHLDENRYFRFSVDQGLQTIGLDEYKKRGAMESATELYLVHQARKNRVRDCIQNLRLKQNKTNLSFAALINEYTVQFIQQHSERHKASWIVPFERNDLFVGRESQLTQLEKRLFERSGTTKIAIMGLGGVGKTQLLLQLVYQTKDKYEHCSIIWIPAISMENLQQVYLDVAQQLHISGWEEDKADVKRLVQEYLSKESTGQWLLVFDNADDIDMWVGKPGFEQESGRLIDYLPRSKQGCIVFTTRDRKTAVKLANQNIVEVPEMDEETATKLLQKHLPNYNLVNNNRDTEALLEELTYLPLAIVQAAAYINENCITLTHYLSLLKDQEEEAIELLSRDFEDDGRYRDRDVNNPVATTWLISFEQICNRDRLAAEFLSFMACINSKDVPQSLLPPEPSRTRVTEAIGMLKAYSFISERPADLALDVHRLVHLATRNWLRGKNRLAQWTESAVTRIDDMFPNINYKNRSVWKRYLVHARYALDCNLIDKVGEKRVNLAWKVGICLENDGRFNEAELFVVEVMEIRKKVLGLEHPGTLISMNNLAGLLESQGKYDEAEPIYRQTLQLTEKVFGLEHPNTLRSMNNLAGLLNSKGKYDEAEPIYRQTLQLTEKVLGLEHPDTLGSMNNLAGLLKSQGEYDEAEPIYRQTLQLIEKVLGLEHPHTLGSMNNLAGLLSSQGKCDEAEPIYRQTLQLKDKVLGLEHPSTLTTMNNLAMLLKRKGKYDEAEPIYRQTLQLRDKVLGLEHPSTLTSMNNLAGLLKSQGKYDEAEPIYRQTLQLREKVLSLEHPDTLGSMNNLAGLLKSQDKYDEAEPIYRQTLRLRENVLGLEHPDTLGSMNNLALILKSQGKYDEAEPIYRQTLQLMEKVLGLEHPDTLRSMNNLAGLLDSQGMCDEAEPIYRQTLQLMEKVLGLEHPDTLRSMNNLAGLLDSQGMCDEAEPIYRQTLQLKEKVLSLEHPSPLTSMNNLAGLLDSQGKYDEAEQIY